MVTEEYEKIKIITQYLYEENKSPHVRLAYDKPEYTHSFFKIV